MSTCTGTSCLWAGWCQYLYGDLLFVGGVVSVPVWGPPVCGRGRVSTCTGTSCLWAGQYLYGDLLFVGGVVSVPVRGPPVCWAGSCQYLYADLPFVGGSVPVRGPPVWGRGPETSAAEFLRPVRRTRPSERPWGGCCGPPRPAAGGPSSPASRAHRPVQSRRRPDRRTARQERDATPSAAEGGGETVTDT